MGRRAHQPRSRRRMDYSSIPEQTRVAVWGDQDTYTVGSKGKMLSDTEATTDITQAKVNEL